MSFIHLNSSEKILWHLEKDKIFLKLLNIMQIKVRQEEETHLKIAKSAIQLYTIVLAQREICTAEWLILQSLKTYLTLFS